MPQVLEFADVVVRRNARNIVDHVDWTVTDDQRWVVLGPNGAGKTTILQLAATLLHPTSGEVTILDERLGRTDVFELRPRIGFASSAMARRVPPEETVLDVVLTAAFSVLGRWNEEYETIDERRARRVLGEWKLDHLADRTFGTLSDGEQKRVQIARAVMTDPELLLLDEPTASLDLGAREELLGLLGGYAQAPTTPAMVMVTHQVEEIPVGFTHVLLLRDGAVVAAGPVEETLTAQNLSDTFGMPIALSVEDGRYAARATSGA
ncbi:ABC transporter ATP-binding protein [Microbacterium lacticum]|uniref:Iron complex transport system ATP-binding protein n=1 Tax=Microbacterium lacticum TaxID=33885 RepID=A0A4Y3UKR1_9MICO|nr:ABC transporter ATP-binding protein [Microbacterium lacticum]TQN00663.1 iron complex transport system ATP-binding protein [Microbacterium lacticum]GEB94060.1 iron ABC transporter ATP-binding protein [Microbacterium lacticum]GGN19436.1 iron ABC transporter ATP-binding protein [Microbacterium lacticum]